MRFRRRVKLFPGVVLNFSKSGISTTFGFPGASINFNKQGAFLNTGIPGTGIYDRKRIGRSNKTKPENGILPNYDFPNQEEITELKSTENVEETTTEGLKELRDTLIACYQEKNELQQDITKAKRSLKAAQIILILSYVIVIGFFIKWFRRNREEKKSDLLDLENQLAECFVNIDIKTDESIEESFKQLHSSYKGLITCAKMWDITSTVNNNQTQTRSIASQGVVRKLVNFGFGNLDIIKSKYDALHFENANGGDLYVYPAFIAIVDNNRKFGLVDIREVEFNFVSQKFLEQEGIPADSKVVENTWAKVNKNGTPDKRFKNNYQIPVCLYGSIEIKSTSGLNEAYSFSNHDNAEQFAIAFKSYQKAITK